MGRGVPRRGHRRPRGPRARRPARRRGAHRAVVHGRHRGQHVARQDRDGVRQARGHVPADPAQLVRDDGRPADDGPVGHRHPDRTPARRAGLPDRHRARRGAAERAGGADRPGDGALLRAAGARDRAGGGVRRPARRPFPQPGDDVPDRSRRLGRGGRGDRGAGAPGGRRRRRRGPPGRADRGQAAVRAVPDARAERNAAGAGVGTRGARGRRARGAGPVRGPLPDTAGSPGRGCGRSSLRRDVAQPATTPSPTSARFDHGRDERGVELARGRGQCAGTGIGASAVSQAARRSAR